MPPGALRVVAAFPPPVALGRLHPGLPASLRLTGFTWTQYGSLAATVTNVAHEGRDGQVRVELSLAPDTTFPIPLQHGMPGTIEVEVERVAPAALLVRSIGKRLGLARLYIARTLLQGADCLILDESFAALDPETLHQALQCVLERAPTLLVIAHP